MSDFVLGGSAAFIANIRKVQADVAKQKKRGLIAAGALVLNASNQRVPHEEGDFERTGRVTVDEEGNVAAVSYKDVRYPDEAARLHEDLSMHHDEGRSAKFLEKAFTQTADGVRTILGDHISSAMD